VVTTSRFEKVRVSEIRLQPIDLNYTARGADRGVPKIASAELAKTILERVQRLSQPFGTRVIVQDGIGIVRPAPGSASDASR